MARSASWSARATRLGERIPKPALHPAVVSWAESAEPRAAWTIALSGGADSLAVLLLLWAHFPKRRKSLRVVHFDHRLRGAASRADARFCAAVAKGLGVPASIGVWARARPNASEAEARAARFAYFRERLKAVRGRALWLGHHQDDVAETLLMRISRGSGTAGLAAPRPLHRFADDQMHLRPLLTLKKAEVEAALKACRIPWRKDATNAGGVYFRNRIRRDVLPAWVEASGRDAVAGAALSRALLEEDDLALEAWVDSLALFGKRGQLRLTVLRNKPVAVVRRALHRWLAQPGRHSSLSRQGFERLLVSITTGQPTRHSLGAEGFAVLRGRGLFLETAPPNRGNTLGPRLT